MNIEPIVFQNASINDVNLAWKLLEKCFAKGERQSMRDLLLKYCDNIEDFIQAPSPAKDHFFNRIIKSGELELLSQLLLKHKNPAELKNFLIQNYFGSFCETKNSIIIDCVFKNSNLNLNHQQWTQALLKKRFDILENTKFNIQEQRAISFIESYFFDIQLTHLKYLENFIGADQWSLRFARNALSTNKGPAVINFFVEKSFQKQNLGQEDIWETLFECIKNSNSKAFDKIKLLIDSQERSFDWEKTSNLSDFSIQLPTPPNQDDEPANVRISMNKTPAELKKISLLEFAWITGELNCAQQIMDCVKNAQFLNTKRASQWQEHIEQTNKLKRVNHKVATIINSNLDILLMQASAQGVNVKKDPSIKL